MNFEKNLLFLLMVTIYLDTTKHHQVLLAPASAAASTIFSLEQGHTLLVHITQ